MTGSIRGVLEWRHCPGSRSDVSGDGSSLARSWSAGAGQGAHSVLGRFIVSRMLLVCVLLLTGKVSAMTLEELAEICTAQEAAIQDVFAEYERDREPPYTTKDFVESVVAIPRGPQKITWATTRPFADRFLWTDSTEWVDERDHRSHVTETRTYNGEVGKRLEVRRDGMDGEPSVEGLITKSRRFILPVSSTPEHFTLVRFRKERPDYTLAEALRKPEWADLINDIQQVGPFRTIRVDFHQEGVRDKQGNRVLLSRFYFSVDHGYTPVQFELYARNKVVTRDSVTELVEASPGIWYPKSARTTEFNMGDTPYTYTFRASKVVVNQGLTQEFFDIDFPPGTEVQDEILNSQYFIRPTEDQFNKWLETQEVLNRHQRKAPESEFVSQSVEPPAALSPPGKIDPAKDGGEPGGPAHWALVPRKSWTARILAVIVKPFLLGLGVLTAAILGLRRWFVPKEGKTGNSE
jgi:outer membrane lipoprotein-sorting protein